MNEVLYAHIEFRDHVKYIYYNQWVDDWNCYTKWKTATVWR